jgi:hypothetical protein
MDAFRGGMSDGFPHNQISLVYEKQNQVKASINDIPREVFRISSLVSLPGSQLHLSLSAIYQFNCLSITPRFMLFSTHPQNFVWKSGRRKKNHSLS